MTDAPAPSNVPLNVSPSTVPNASSGKGDNRAELQSPVISIALDRSAIDASCRVPVLLSFGTATVWLLVGTALAMIASLKLHSPQVMSDSALLAFGRVRPAHLNAVVYGWSGLAGIGTLLWLMCRLCRVPLACPWVPTSAILIWNIGVATGLWALLHGGGNSLEWIEFPASSAFMIFIALAMIGLWTMIVFARRKQQQVYVSQWYIFAAIFWFPWVYATVQMLVIFVPVKGVAQESIHWWFGHNVLGVWFTPLGLAAIYYLIPKVLGRPIHSYYLSILGFWSLALFYNWAGGHHLVAGPVPAWLVTLSIVASMMMFIPVTATAINHHMTTVGHFRMLKYSPTLRFVVFGAMSYTVVSVQGSLMSLHWINEPLHFTQDTIAHAHLGMYAFFTMVMFGAMYYIVPRLTGREWASARLIRLHFWAVAIGVLLMFVSLTAAGVIQGLEMNQARQSISSLMHERGWISGAWSFFSTDNLSQHQDQPVDFVTIVRDTMPWLWMRSVSGILLTIGHIAFAWLLMMNLLGIGQTRGTGPTLFAQPPREKMAEEIAKEILAG